MFFDWMRSLSRRTPSKSISSKYAFRWTIKNNCIIYYSSALVI